MVSCKQIFCYNCIGDTISADSWKGIVDKMKIGVDYYPEHWDKKMWADDADKMKEAGVQIVRLAEFAWSRLEPQEGQYCFEWLDEAIALFAQREISVFLCTPTCTPPLWAFEKYPEIIQVDKTGHRIAIGIRGHRCLNSPIYRTLCEKIIRKMVSHYRDNPWVIGYQIDNELEANHCCCPVCEEKFRTFIKKKYQTVEGVNQAYGNSVWSGEYSDFSQVRPPFGAFQTWLNPSYMLDFNRYASESTVEYVRFQEQLIRQIDPDALITTNNWLCENMPDFYRMFESLDFVSYDNYPTTCIPKDAEELYSHAFHLDLMRGIKKKNFWIMEQLSGSLGSWMPMQPTLQPGMLKGYSMQAIAHGADAVLHFRWRTAISGAEMFWHGILDHSNVTGRRYREFCDLCATVKKMEELDGSIVKNQVAILYSSEQEYGFKIQPQVDGMHYFTQLKAYHDAFTANGIGVDIVDWLSNLSEYKIVVAPTLYITNSVIEESLEQFVANGGTLILTNRSGVKDEYNRCIMEPLPTVFTKLTGATVKEYDPIGRKEQRVVIAEQLWKDLAPKWDIERGTTLGRYWCDIIEPLDAVPIAYYDDNFYKGEAAATVHSYGDGRVYYIGTVWNRRGTISFVQSVLEKAGMEYVAGLPLGVERSRREKGESSWTFLFNNTEQTQKFTWKLVQNGVEKESHDAILEPFACVFEKSGVYCKENM